MRRALCIVLLAFPLISQARGGHHCHARRVHFVHRSSFLRHRPSFSRGFYSAPLQPLQYNGQSAVDLLELDGSYTRDSLVKALALTLAPKGNRMLPCVLDFNQVTQDGGYARFLADWEPPAREELLGYLQQLECEDTLRITREVLARANPTPQELAQATQELLDDGNDLYDALWDYCYDHREAVAGL